MFFDVKPSSLITLVPIEVYTDFPINFSKTKYRRTKRFMVECYSPELNQKILFETTEKYYNDVQSGKILKTAKKFPIKPGFFGIPWIETYMDRNLCY